MVTKVLPQVVKYQIYEETVNKLVTRTAEIEQNLGVKHLLISLSTNTRAYSDDSSTEQSLAFGPRVT